MQQKTWVAVAACVCIAVAALLLSISERPAQADEPKKDLPVPKAKLWAGLTVTSPTFGADDVTDARLFMVSFALVIDGGKNFAPTEEVNTSMLLINGKELKEWPFIINNGPREASGTELKTGESLRFGKAIGKYCTEPGISKVQWKGKSFESAVVEFRVLPAERPHIGSNDAKKPDDKEKLKTDLQFEQVVWVRNKAPQVPALYVLVPEVPDLKDLDWMVKVVRRYAPAALREVDELAGPDARRRARITDKLVVAFVIPQGWDKQAWVTGFSIDQLKEYASVPEEKALESIRRHTWKFQKLPLINPGP